MVKSQIPIPSTIIYPATAADLPHILRLIRGLAEYEKVLHTFTATEADLQALLFGPVPRGHAILAKPAGEPPAGIAVYYDALGTFSGRPGLYLEDLFVDLAHRGTGLGVALMRRLAAIAVEDGCSTIKWSVLNWNQPSIDFYERLGAKQVTDWQTRQLEGVALQALAKGTTHG